MGKRDLNGSSRSNIGGALASSPLLCVPAAVVVVVEVLAVAVVSSSADDWQLSVFRHLRRLVSQRLVTIFRR